jgi:hypothetical protein
LDTQELFFFYKFYYIQGGTLTPITKKKKIQPNKKSKTYSKKLFQKSKNPEGIQYNLQKESKNENQNNPEGIHKRYVT